MAQVFADHILEVTAVTGTGPAALLGPPSQGAAFSSVMNNGDTCDYEINDQSGGDWETGNGTYSSGSNALTRTTIYSSSNGNAAVNFPAGNKNIFITLPYFRILTFVAKASLASPAFTGVPTAPTAAPGTNTTQLATCQFVMANVTGASSMYTLPQSANSNNATNVKNAAGVVASLQVYNFAAYPIFLKLYNKATAPNPAADTPVKTIPVPANSTPANGAGEVINFGPGGLGFTTGIGFAIVKGQAVNDNTSVAANDATFNLDYV